MHVFQYTGHGWSGSPVPPCIHLWVFCWMASKSLGFLILFSVLHFALCASTLCSQPNTCSLATYLFSRVVISLNILSVMPSSFSLPMKCSVSVSVPTLSYFCSQFTNQFLGRLIGFSMQCLVL